jgi:hypothetical protein
MSESGAGSFKIIRPHRVVNWFHAVLIVIIIFLAVIDDIDEVVWRCTISDHIRKDFLTFIIHQRLY